VTIQNYFRLYSKLSGMTGTAATEAAGVPRHLQDGRGRDPDQPAGGRIDDDDEVYRTAAEKNAAIIGPDRGLLPPRPADPGGHGVDREVRAAVGAAQGPQFELDGKKAKGIPHSVLNARYHEQEALIVADAGVPGAVTIATNMAGRGTDIQLGGNVDMKVRQWREEQRGLGVEVTPEAEASEGRDRGRDRDARRPRWPPAASSCSAPSATRAGASTTSCAADRPPGRPRPLEVLPVLRGRPAAHLRRRAAGRIMRTFGVQEGEAITHKWLNKAIATAQKRVEQRNYEIRKNLLKYDDVVNDQRKEIGELKEEVQRIFGLDLPVEDWAKEEGIADEEIKTRLNDQVDRLFAQRAAQYGPDVWRQVEKSVLMQLFDQSWKEHLLHLDHLRQGIGLRAYGQKDPLNEYKREAFNLFNDLLTGLREQVVALLATLQLRMEQPPMPEMPTNMHEVHEDPSLASRMSDDPAFDPADPHPEHAAGRERAAEPGAAARARRGAG
jgi:preprotein translocase subunit SecA